jgi:ABC-type sugar transport system substrate-binding protein
LQESDAIIVTAVNDQLLPTVAQKCREAGVVLMTTEDPGFDEFGEPIPHVGLDDYALGEASAKNLLEATTERGFFEDPSQLRIVMLDTPKIASMHKRVAAAQDVITAAYPDLPESTWIYADVDDSLPDNVIKKFSDIFQANSDIKYWIILGGDEGAPQGTYPIMKENGVDFKNVALTMVAGSTVITDYMALDEDVANAYFFCGLLPKPAGQMTMTVLGTFLKEGGELPIFTGYDLNAYDGSNFMDYVEAMANQ